MKLQEKKKKLLWIYNFFIMFNNYADMIGFFILYFQIIPIIHKDLIINDFYEKWNRLYSILNNLNEREYKDGFWVFLKNKNCDFFNFLDTDKKSFISDSSSQMFLIYLIKF